MKTANKYKINFDYYDLEDKLSVESVWAIKEDNYYRIQNIPFFIPNIAFGDLISVEIDENELYFDEIIETSENSTLQVIFFDEKDVKTITTKLQSFNCGWEGSHLSRYISINVPKNENYFELKEYLTQLTNSKIIEFKEACLSNKHKLDIS
ncbi:DUF4265 domain-containing protein [Flavobacterium psychrophilum]|uniref:DUF4265 domain-containing protein n=1 Tax=Flavobacterium psychrophilum TaxID=96345 RepID=UPI0006187CCB|nr:DUF4265 domain-containing protein [Flavobacterium psychrophilum]